MGRKPNQAIRHYFERGPKLNDNSNRYQQTCKRCGEKFEKGRQEALVAHVAKTCQGVTVTEREKFIAEVSWGKPSAKSKKQATPLEAPPNLPELSGLEALAEVSRHHGQQSLQNDLIAQSSDFINQAGLTTQPTLAGPVYSATGAASLLGIATTASDLGISATPSLDPQLQLAALRALLPGRSGYLGRSIEPDDSLVDYSHGEAPTIGVNYARHAPVPVIEVASPSPGPADDLVDYSHGQAPVIDDHYTRHRESLPLRDLPPILNPRTLDPSLRETQDVVNERDEDEMGLAAGFVADETAQSAPKTSASTSPMPTRTATDAPSYHLNTVTNLHEPQFQIWSPSGASPTAPKKVRGAFAPDRRTAVKEVRKKGACLRCRMLKKSCDSSDPCKECAKLENARMWKGQCVRTRLSQIFNVFSSTLFMGIAHRTIEELRATTNFVNLPGRLEVSYLVDAGLFMTFPCLWISSFEKGRSRNLIDTEEDGADAGSTFGSKFTQYGSRLLEMHFDPNNKRRTFPALSIFMHHTLKLALTMTSRTLVAQAIHLWICTTFLTTPITSLTTIHEPRLPPTGTAPVDSLHNTTQPSSDVHYIYIQLCRKLERACDVHFKAVMTELEKSLIQRKSSDNFETFIGTVILLRCLEMVGYLYKGFDHLVDPSTTASEKARKDVLYGAEAWPLQHSPSHYWQQGERFSDLLGSMLRLRKVMPAFQVRGGKLVAENEIKAVKDWFEAIALEVDVLKRARDRPYDDVGESAWELRWMGKLFEA